MLATPKAQTTDPKQNLHQLKSHSLDSNSSPQCRICLMDYNPQTLIIPCLCTGSIRYVHQPCLKQWISRDLTSPKPPETSCQICKQPYSMIRRTHWKCRFCKQRIGQAATFFISTIFMVLTITAMLIVKNTEEIHFKNTIIGILGGFLAGFTASSCVLFSIAFLERREDFQIITSKIEQKSSFSLCQISEKRQLAI